MAFLACMTICSSDIDRCQESTSSPAVSNSISEGIIEEEEDEEVAEESNKKRMKEDDQEVLLISLLFIFKSLRTTSWDCWFLLCSYRRKVFSPGEWSCQRQKNTGRAGSEASLPSFSPAQHLNFSYSQVSPLARKRSEAAELTGSLGGVTLVWRNTSGSGLQFRASLHLIAQFHTWFHLLCRSGQAWQRPDYWADARWEAQPAILRWGTSAWNSGPKYMNVWCDFLSSGKFQMQVLPQCGHAVHEDAPEKVRQSVHINRHKETLERNWNLPNGKDGLICRLFFVMSDQSALCSFCRLQML